MKWRCPQCGKPHEKNDPPCDNCGHHKFERAVVPQAAAETDHEQFVWACSECGRHHQRNNPPCSRCGAASFEKKPLDYDDFEPDDTSSYLELAGRLEVGAAIVLVALVTVGVLGVTGVIDIPGLTPQGPPTISDVPGDADEVDGIALSAVESELVGELDAQRTDPLRRESGLDSMATYLNRDFVKVTYTDADSAVDREDLRRFDTGCDGDILFSRAVTTRPVDTDQTADSVAGSLLPDLQSTTRTPTDSSITRIGVDAHAGKDGRVFVWIAYC